MLFRSKTSAHTPTAYTTDANHPTRRNWNSSVPQSEFLRALPAPVMESQITHVTDPTQLPRKSRAQSTGFRKRIKKSTFSTTLNPSHHIATTTHAAQSHHLMPNRHTADSVASTTHSPLPPTLTLPKMSLSQTCLALRLLYKLFNRDLTAIHFSQE